MPSPILAGQVGLAVYAILLGVGGVMGFVKAKSRPSLIAGVTSAVVALISLCLTFRGAFGFHLGLILAAAMTIAFGARLAKTRKFMPSGMLLTMSLVMCGLLGWVEWSLAPAG